MLIVVLKIKDAHIIKSVALNFSGATRETVRESEYQLICYAISLQSQPSILGANDELVLG